MLRQTACSLLVWFVGGCEPAGQKVEKDTSDTGEPLVREDSGADSPGPDETGPDDTQSGDSDTMDPGADDSGAPDSGACAPTAAAQLATERASVQGSWANGALGAAVASAGDVNGDGLGDVLIGAPVADVDTDQTAAALLFLGPIEGTLRATDADATLNGQLGPWREGSLSWDDDLAGSALNSAGDVDGDGYDDVVIGASWASDEAMFSGAAYLAHGPLAGTRSLEDVDLVLHGDQQYHLIGTRVDGAGDQDGDGTPDVLVTAPSAWEENPYDSVYLVSGATTGEHLVSDEAIATVWLDSWVGLDYGASSAQLGSAARRFGDQNGDGLDDIALGAHTYSLSEELGSVGALWVGEGPITGEVDVRDLEVEILGESRWAFLGWALDGLGDANCDGYDDLAVTEPKSTAGGGDGAVYIFMGPLSAAATPTGTVLNSGSVGTIGYGVAGPGDVDGDDVPDLLVSSAGAGDMSADSHLFSGVPEGTATIDEAAQIIEGYGDLTSWVSTAGAGDVDGDGASELLLGQSGGRGAAVLYGL